jgi:large subunit ribosomal protein L18
VTKTLRHLYCQIIDDVAGHTLVAASTLDADVRDGLNGTCNIAAAEAVGTALAKRALKKKIKRVVFDRAGFAYHGKIKALSEAAREAGLEC